MIFINMHACNCIGAHDSYRPIVKYLYSYVGAFPYTAIPASQLDCVYACKGDSKGVAAGRT